MTDSLETLAKSLDQIQAWSNTLLLFACCIVVGYILRVIPKFPNNAIPVAVILVGPLVAMFLAENKPLTMTAHVWWTRNFIIGLVVGFVSWMGHYFLISKLEDWLAAKSGTVAKILNIKKPEDPANTPPAP